MRDKVRSTDFEAIKSFNNEYVQNANVYSAIGVMGLGVKYIGKSIVGIQYPAMFRSPPKNKTGLVYMHIFTLYVPIR